MATWKTYKLFENYPGKTKKIPISTQQCGYFSIYEMSAIIIPIQTSYEKLNSVMGIIATAGNCGFCSSLVSLHMFHNWFLFNLSQYVTRSHSSLIHWTLLRSEGQYYKLVLYKKKLLPIRHLTAYFTVENNSRFSEVKKTGQTPL